MPNQVRTRLADIQMAIQKTLGVGNNVLSAVAFTQEGMTITWMTAGPYANTLVYTVSPCWSAQS